MRTGKRRCRIDFYIVQGAVDGTGYPIGKALWRSLWGDLTPERGDETTMADQRVVETYLTVSFDYLDLCEGDPPRLVSQQRLGGMAAEMDRRQFDIYSIKPDHINRRDVVCRFLERVSGA